MSEFDPRPDTGPTATPAARLKPKRPDPVHANANAKGARTPSSAAVAARLTIDLQPGDCPPGYATRHVVVVLETAAQRAALKLLAASLDKQAAQLVSGTRTVTPAQAILWLLEQLATELPADVLAPLVEGIE